MMATRRFFSTLKVRSSQRTALYDFHVNQLRAKMVPFAGYEMPVEYKEVVGGVLKEHMQCRNAAAFFDVSHMGQLRFTGPDRLEFLNKLVVADLLEQREKSAVLSLITNARGGIIDDTIITKFSDHIFMVVNAGCKDKDLVHIRDQLRQFTASGKQVTLEELTDRSLIAIQGPKAASVLQKLVMGTDLSRIKFMTADFARINMLESTEVVLSRCGYTGEDGFEISVKSNFAEKLTDLLLTASEGELKPAGLGSRDSLRLEAGLCLYGHDLNEDISPIEASLAWTVAASKKKSGAFLGGHLTLKHLAEGPTKRRVGFSMPPGPSAREGVAIFSNEGRQIGTVTRGTFSPVLKHGVGMGYVETAFAKLGTPIQLDVRGKKLPAVIAKMPFVPSRYYK